MSNQNVSKLAIILVALVAGSMMVVISLFAANQATTQDDMPSASRRLYLGQEILPDHVVYPALMAMDRIILQYTPVEQHGELEIKYAKNRLDAACKLLDRDKDNYQNLAVSTINKSKEYMLAAADQAISTNNDALKSQVIFEMDQHIKNIESCRDWYKLSSSDIEKILEELKVSLNFLVEN